MTNPIGTQPVNNSLWNRYKQNIKTNFTQGPFSNKALNVLNGIHTMGTALPLAFSSAVTNTAMPKTFSPLLTPVLMVDQFVRRHPSAKP